MIDPTTYTTAVLTIAMHGVPIGNAAALFASTCLLVFALGLQSLNVNHGHTTAAVLNSFLIGTAHLICYKLVPEATTLEVLAFLSGGPLGIWIAMRIHPARRGKAA
jgi:hypothetical protein